MRPSLAPLGARDPPYAHPTRLADPGRNYRGRGHHGGGCSKPSTALPPRPIAARNIGIARRDGDALVAELEGSKLARLVIKEYVLCLAFGSTKQRFFCGSHELQRCGRTNLRVSTCDQLFTRSVRPGFVEAFHSDAGRDLDKHAVGGGEGGVGQG
jgi:hypothetical protein